MVNTNLVLLVGIVLIICIVYALQNNLEAYQVIKNSVKVKRTVKDNFQDQEPDRSICEDQGEWQDNQPVKSIISRYTGIRLNVCASDSSDCNVGNINSTYIVLVDTPNGDIPKGVLTVQGNGSFSTEVQTNSPTQLWNLILIEKPADFQMYSTETPTNTRYPYYLCLKTQNRKSDPDDLETNPNLALQYENGSLSVRLLGDYESQKWLINPDPVENLPVMILNNNQYSGFSPEFLQTGNRDPNFNVPAGMNNAVHQLNTLNSRQVMESLNQIQQLLESQGGTTPPTTTTFGDAPITVNLKLGGTPPSLGVTSESAENQENFQTTSNIDNLLNQYEKQTNQEDPQDTLNALIQKDSVLECKIPNFDDYVKLSDMASCNGCSNL